MAPVSLHSDQHKKHCLFDKWAVFSAQNFSSDKTNNSFWLVEYAIFRCRHMKTCICSNTNKWPFNNYVFVRLSLRSPAQFSIHETITGKNESSAQFGMLCVYHAPSLSPLLHDQPKRNEKKTAQKSKIGKSPSIFGSAWADLRLSRTRCAFEFMRSMASNCIENRRQRQQNDKLLCNWTLNEIIK